MICFERQDLNSRMDYCSSQWISAVKTETSLRHLVLFLPIVA